MILPRSENGRVTEAAKAVLAILAILIPLVTGVVKFYLDYKFQMHDLEQQMLYFHGPWPPANKDMHN